jgi:murein L,D-transpeptidase YcbB/YkuD
MRLLRYLTWTWIAIAAASPALAQDPASAPASPVQQSAPFVAPLVALESGVETFYATRGQASIWFRDSASREAAAKLPAILRRATIEGIADGPELAAGVEAALARGLPADDKILSAAWVRYVRVLTGPAEGMSFGDPALEPKAASAATILSAAAAAPSLVVHVDQVSRVNPLYSALREAAAAGGGDPDPRVRATLDRLRILPAKGRAIVVDSASAQLWMLEDGHPVDRMKVVVGRKISPTPLVAGTIHYVTLNPYWNIPADVARDKVAPLVLKRGVKYLKAARYVTSDGFGTKAADIAAGEIDWKAVAAGDAPVHIRQLPGGNNMMGAMKFGFANEHDIFLHDTPQRNLFARDKRTFSMGCIRLEHADRLARWLLGKDVDPRAEPPETHVALDAGVPVYVTYMTAKVEEGRLAFVDDVYAWDAVPEEAPKAVASVTAGR